MTDKNELGVIAHTYHELHGLELLEDALSEHPVSKSSYAGIVRSIFQAVEVALWSLTDLTVRATHNLAEGRVGAATVRLIWAHGFHTVLNRLSLLPYQLGFISAQDNANDQLSIQDSFAYQDYVNVVKEFDHTVLYQCSQERLDPENAISNFSTDRVEFELFHVARLCNHEALIWAHRLNQVPINSSFASYETFVAPRKIHAAVYDTALSGDTFFMQFRGLHQIPEIFARTLNDLLEKTILTIRADQLQQAFEFVSRGNSISEGILVCLPILARNLSTSDYHQIRENLGLTSGSHSVSIRHHLFGDLYEQLWEELRSYSIKTFHPTHVAISDEEIIEVVNCLRATDLRAWFVSLLFGECIKLKMVIDQWRELHLHFPRNNLGGNLTKSLTGSPDAIQVTRQMQHIARAKDPMKFLVCNHTSKNNSRVSQLQLEHYLSSKESLDYYLLNVTGQITQERFKAVQQQSGFFQQQCPFKHPPQRRV